VSDDSSERVLVRHPSGNVSFICLQTPPPPYWYEAAVMEPSFDARFIEMAIDPDAPKCYRIKYRREQELVGSRNGLALQWAYVFDSVERY